jgi:superfamily II DNA or RNA helicase
MAQDEGRDRSADSHRLARPHGAPVAATLSVVGGVREDGCMPLQRFSEPTRAWFSAAFAEPTPAQLGAWEAISKGRHALVVAPTGSGKTLSAFLWAVDRL